MKKFTSILFALGLMSAGTAQTLQTGPSTTISPGVYPTVAGGTMVSIMSAGESVAGYTMAGIGDGMGVIDNGGSTFTLVMNHEISTPGGSPRAHGQPGAFVSKWVINKSNFSVVSGADLIQSVNLWTGSTYTNYTSVNSTTLVSFSRFCSANLPEVTAFYNPASGKGTQDRIFNNGEESGNEGRAFAHIVTGAEAGVSYELPHLGKASWENAVASPYPQDKTIVALLDDSSPAGQVYIYVGNKTYSGNTVDKAGLTGGKLYGVSILGLVNEQSGSFPAPNTKFNLIDMGTVHNITGTTLNTNSNNYGVTNFLRPEDGSWDPNRPSDFYFVTTNAFTSPSRMWRLRFSDINFPELGGTITAVLDGTEGQKMLDNVCHDNHGNIMLQEDPGNQSYLAKIYQYNIFSDVLTQVCAHDSTRFKVAGPSFITIDEETSGIIDIQNIKAPGWFLLYDQIHASMPSPMVENGQLLAFYNPATAAANPEINITGNAQNIVSGATVIANNNNTNFGSVNVGTAVAHPFVIQNTSTGTLIVGGLFMSGANAGDFSISGPSVPFTVAPNGSLSVTVYFKAPFSGTRNAVVNVTSSDADEKYYTFAVQGIGVLPEINVQGNAVNIASGNTQVSVNDNTNFGTLQLGTSVTKNFVIQNTGSGTLTINNILFGGPNSNEFVLVSPPALPLTLAGNATQNISVMFTPLTTGTRSAQMAISNDDSDESNYTFVVQGKAEVDVGLVSQQNDDSFVSLFPNPTNNEATLKLKLNNNTKVAVNIYNITGALVMSLNEREVQKGENQMTLNTSSLSNGEYFVTVSNGSKLNTLRLVVVH